jgi:hypothetical protein
MGSGDPYSERIDCRTNNGGIFLVYTYGNASNISSAVDLDYPRRNPKGPSLRK